MWMCFLLVIGVLRLEVHHPLMRIRQQKVIYIENLVLKNGQTPQTTSEADTCFETCYCISGPELG